MTAVLCVKGMRGLLGIIKKKAIVFAYFGGDTPNPPEIEERLQFEREAREMMADYPEVNKENVQVLYFSKTSNREAVIAELLANNLFCVHLEDPFEKGSDIMQRMNDFLKLQGFKDTDFKPMSQGSSSYARSHGNRGLKTMASNWNRSTAVGRKGRPLHK